MNSKPIVISKAGNINGHYNTELSNEPNFIEKALLKDYDVMIDVFFENGVGLFTGNKDKKHRIVDTYLTKRAQNLWVSCADLDTFYYLLMYKSFVNMFIFDSKTDFWLTTRSYIITTNEENHGPRSVLIAGGDVSKEIANKFHGICCC